MEQVISYKERQMGFLQDVESLKQEKAALVAEKVRRYICMIYTPRLHTSSSAGEGHYGNGCCDREYQPYALADCPIS